MSRYSLKKVYRNNLNMSNNRLLAEAEMKLDGIITGKLSSDAMEFFDLKDGSGGRGEYSIVYDILNRGGKFPNPRNKDSSVSSLKKNLFSVEKNTRSEYIKYIKTKGIGVTKAKRKSVITALYNNQISKALAEFKDEVLQEELDNNNIEGLRFDILNFLKELPTDMNHNDACNKIKDKLYEIDKYAFLPDKNLVTIEFKYKSSALNPIDDVPGIIKALEGTNIIDNVTNNTLRSDGSNTASAGYAISGKGANVVEKINNLFSSVELNNLIASKNEERHVKRKRAIEIGDESFGLAMLASVTSSGESSKSTDISIDKYFLNQTQISKYKSFTNNRLTIECKEIKDLKHVFTQGIRLGGGSREALFVWSDFVFALSVFSIALNLSDNPQSETGQLLYKIKKGEIGKDDFIKLINSFSGSDESPGVSGFLDKMSNITGNISNPIKKQIADKCVDLLRNTFNNVQDPKEISNQVDQELRNVISKSVNADWFMIIWGQDETIKENNSYYGKTIKKGSYIMIHKSAYNKLLTTSKISNSGIAYAKLKNSSDYDLRDLVMNNLTLAESLSSSKSKKSLTLLNENRIVLSKRERLIKEITKLSGIKYKIINEGGKAGHMMHPYENLHLKISDMIDMIQDFRNDFEISEKVDGANLFFRVDPELNKVFFSRNKSDMSHQETLEKFGPDHPAHILFKSGSNAVFNGIKSSLNKQDIQRIFGQAPKGGKTYINFEIMHPEKSNQIRYDMKYVVFHSIVDYDINGNIINSSPDDERLLYLLEKLQPYFDTHEDGFNLGSNFKVKLNNLSEKDIEELLKELSNVSNKLNLTNDMTIADAVKLEIKTLLDQQNITELLADDKIDMIYDFVTNESSSITGNQIKKDLDKEIKKSLVGLGLTSKAKAYKIVKRVTKNFRPIFILLGIKLLHNIPSRYMSSDASKKNVNELRELLKAALEDYDYMMNIQNPSDIQTKLMNTLSLHVANIRNHGIERSISSPIEGGVFIGRDGNTYKVTGGFAPLNQILGTGMRNLDHMPKFKNEFIRQKRR